MQKYPDYRRTNGKNLIVPVATGNTAYKEKQMLELMEFVVEVTLSFFVAAWAIFIWNFMTTPKASYFYVNSRIAEIGIIPVENFRGYLGGVNRIKIHMDVAPFFNKREIYLPVKFVAMSSGIEEKDIVSSSGILAIKKDDGMLILDSYKRTINNNGKITNASMLVKNNEIMLPVGQIEKIFNLKIKQISKTKIAVIPD